MRISDWSSDVCSSDLYADARGNLGAIDVASYQPGDTSKPNVTFGTPTETDEREAGLYAKLTFRPIQRLALIGGARVSSFEGENSSATQDVRESGYVTPYGGLVFDLDDQQDRKSTRLNSSH